jgi:hypothetical protein
MARPVEVSQPLVKCPFLAKNLDGWTFRPYTSARSNQEREFDPRGAESGSRMNGT